MRTRKWFSCSACVTSSNDRTSIEYTMHRLVPVNYLNILFLCAKVFGAYNGNKNFLLNSSANYSPNCSYSTIRLFLWNCHTKPNQQFFNTWAKQKKINFFADWNAVEAVHIFLLHTHETLSYTPTYNLIHFGKTLSHIVLILHFVDAFTRQFN